jgi:hypothetical protein
MSAFTTRKNFDNAKVERHFEKFLILAVLTLTNNLGGPYEHDQVGIHNGRSFGLGTLAEGKAYHRVEHLKVASLG